MKIYKKISTITLIILLAYKLLCQAGKILTIYSDVGISGDSVLTWQDNGYFDSNNQEITPAEGYKCFKTTCTGTYAGWGVIYNSEQNFSEYQGGYLRFWIYSSTGNVKVEIERWNGGKSTKYLTQYGWNDSYVNNWRLFNIPLDDFATDISTSVKSPFEITVLAPATFYVDLVRWTTGVDLDTMYIQLKHKTTHVDVSSITWTPVLPSTWNVADIYIKLDFDPGTTYWGIQMYTENKHAEANPKYIGTGNPAGLVLATGTASAIDPLPMSWTIEDSTKIVSELKKGVPEEWVTGGGAYKWFEDRNTSGFDDGKGYVTIWNRKGILYNTWDSGSWDTRAWKNSPNYIYFGANFYSAKTLPYKTNRLIIELYYE